MSKAKYIVIESFKDLHDNNKVYKKGEHYPKPSNKKVSKKRIDELSTDKNKIGAPVIEEIKREED